MRPPSDDRRYAEPGSLTSRLKERTAEAHDAHTIAESTADAGTVDFKLAALLSTPG